MTAIELWGSGFDKPCVKASSGLTYKQIKQFIAEGTINQTENIFATGCAFRGTNPPEISDTYKETKPIRGRIFKYSSSLCSLLHHRLCYFIGYRVSLNPYHFIDYGKVQK